MFRPALMSALATMAVAAVAVPAQASDPIDAQAGYVSKRVIIDPDTGKIVSITDIDERISHRHYCNGHDACFMSGKVPYADHGFYGSAGKKNGSWPYRSGYYTGVYRAQFCWNNNNTCAPELPPRHESFFTDGGMVTGSSVSIR